MRFLLITFLAWFSSAQAQVGTTSVTCIWSGSLADCLPASGILLRNQRQVRFGEATANGTNYAAIQAPSSLAADYTLTLPVDDGTANQVLSTDGSGALSWTNYAVTPTTAGNVYSDGTSLQSVAFSGNGNKIFGVDSAGTTEEAKTLAVGTSGTDFAIANTAGTITFNLPSASSTARGAVTTATQSFAGTKTFDNSVNFSSTVSLNNQNQARFLEATGSGSNYAAIQSPTTLAADYTLTLPVDDGTSNQVLTTNGSGVLSWTTPSTVTIPAAGNVYSDGTALQSIAFTGNANKVFGVNNGATSEEAKTLAVGTSGTDFAIAHSAGTITFNLPSASASNRGAVTTSTQSFAGVKTFNDGVVLDDAASQSTLNFYRESSTAMTWSFANGSGGTPSGSVTARYTRIGSWVNITIPQFTAVGGTSTSILRSSTAIDSFARPATTTVNCSLFVIDGSAFQSTMGYLEIKADGILDLYKTGSGGPWTGNCGPSANFVCAYYVGTGS